MIGVKSGIPHIQCGSFPHIDINKKIVVSVLYQQLHYAVNLYLKLNLQNSQHHIGYFYLHFAFKRRLGALEESSLHFIGKNQEH